MKTWIVVAHRTGAKIFSYEHKNGSTVDFVAKLDNPRGRLKAQEINADKPGVFSSLMAHGTRLVKQQSPTERIAQEFAKKIVDYLEEARRNHSFDDLVLIADPHFLGRLRLLTGKSLKNCIAREVCKDLTGVTSAEIKNRLWPLVEGSPSI